MRKALALGLLLTAVSATAQDGTPSAQDVKFKYEKAIRRIAGVLDVGLARKDWDSYRIIVTVDSGAAKEAVVTLCGKKLDGYPLDIKISGAASATNPAPVADAAGPEPARGSPATVAGACANCTCPCHRKVGQTVAEPRKPEAKIDISRLDDREYAVERCDVLRELLGLPKRKSENSVRCQQMIGWTNDPNKVAWLQKQGIPYWSSAEMPGFVSYTYIRHRQYCPLGMKQVLQDFDRMTPGKSVPPGGDASGAGSLKKIVDDLQRIVGGN